jgi:hypothetical protein
MALRIVRKGTWLYGGTVETPVDVVALDYDWHFLLAHEDGGLEPGEEPEPLGPDGWLYYVRFRNALNPSEPTSPDSRGFASVQEAMHHAEQKVVGGVRWEQLPPNSSFKPNPLRGSA